MDIDITEVDIKRKETFISETVESNSINLDQLEQNINENSLRSKKLFENLKALQECHENTYTNLTKTEVEHVIENIEQLKVDNQAQSDTLHELCDIIRKYLTNIKEIHTDKVLYKQNMQHILHLMYEKVKMICNFDFDESEIGALYKYQMDHVHEIRKSIEIDQNDTCCDDIKNVKKIVSQYYQLICNELDKYTKELSTLRKGSKNYSVVLDKINEFQQLYRRLILYIKQYKTINREKVVACENKEANLEHLYAYLDNVETYMSVRVKSIYNFINNAK